MLAVIVAAAISSLAPNLAVVDDAGNPLAGATVEFIDPRGARDLESTDVAGFASARAHFAAVAADIAKAGYARVRISLARAQQRVVLERALPTIGRVSVATGSAQSLHELPLAASVLDRAALALAPATSADRVLRALPGFDRTRSNSAFTNYGQLRASFSGAGSDRGVVFVDGIPAQDAFGGQIDWQAYPADELERVELLRGAGAALYGSGAVGGALNLETFAPRIASGGADGRISLATGSNALADDSFVARTPLGASVAASLASTLARLEYRDLAPGYGSPLDHPALGESGVTHVRARFADGATTIDGAGIFASDHQDEGRPNYTFDRSLRQESANATHRIGDALASLTYYVRDTTVHNLSDVFPQRPGTLRYVQHVPSDENGLFAALTAAPGPVEYALRIEQRRVAGSSEQYGPSGSLQALGTGVQLSQGIALQATLRGKRFEALAGARADRLRYDDLSLRQTVAASPAPVLSTQSVAGHAEGALSPRLAARYDVGPKLAVRLSSGGGFRGPYLNELVRGFNVGPVVEAPNPNLVPERSRTDDVGLDYLFGSSGGGRLAFDLIATRVSDAIAFVTQSRTLMVRENLDRTQTNGETVTLAQPIGSCARLRLSGTTQYARVTSGPPGTFGKQLAYVPNRSATLGIDAAGRGALSYAVDGSYVGQTYADDLERQPLGAALLFAATVRATTAAGVSFALAGDNLTHQTYLSSIDRYGPPLTLSLRVGIPLGAPAAIGNVVCGSGR